MSNKFQIEIPKPCHENWNKMSPVEQGRFCGSCQKAVVDFTGMSDSQLVSFFKKPSTGSVCGRFENDQLGRNLFVPGKRMPWLKYFLQLLIPTFLFASKAKSQGEPRIVGDTVLVENKKCVKDKDGNLKEDKTGLNKIKGRVINEQGEGITFASIIIKGTHKGVMADEKGNYEIDISSTPGPIIQFSAVGYRNMEILSDSIKQKSNFNVRLESWTETLMGEVVCVDPKPRKRKKDMKHND